jgi:hypothetical protein
MTRKTKPKCDPSKSTPCGYSCIAKGLNCIDELDDNARGFALQIIGNLSQSNKVNRVITNEEAYAVAANAQFLSVATPSEVIAKAFAVGRSELGDDYTDDPTIIDAVWGKLDSTIKKKLREKGKVPKGSYWNPDDPTGNGIANDTRSKYMIEMYIKQNGRDAYTGLPIGLLDSDLEHIVPFSLGGKRSENPDNLVLVSRSVNMHKSNYGLGEWASKVAGSLDKIEANNAKVPKYDKNALADTLTNTPKDNWQDEDIDKFGDKFYYVSKHLGLSNSYTYVMPSGRRAGVRPPVSWGVPVVKLMAKALRENDISLAERVTEANNTLLSNASKVRSKEMDKDEADKVAKDTIDTLRRG